jgi:hypothetical protein
MRVPKALEAVPVVNKTTKQGEEKEVDFDERCLGHYGKIKCTSKR